MKEKHKTIIGSLDQAIWDELKLARNQKINKSVFFSLFYFYLEILNVKIIYFIYLETTRISESLFFFRMSIHLFYFSFRWSNVTNLKMKLSILFFFKKQETKLLYFYNIFYFYSSILNLIFNKLSGLRRLVKNSDN